MLLTNRGLVNLGLWVPFPAPKKGKEDRKKRKKK